jgi:hypothetical protein
MPDCLHNNAIITFYEEQVTKYTLAGGILLETDEDFEPMPLQKADVVCPDCSLTISVPDWHLLPEPLFTYCQHIREQEYATGFSKDGPQTAQSGQEEVYITAETVAGHYYVVSSVRGIATNWDELEPDAKQVTQPILQQRQRDWWAPVYARYPGLAEVPPDEWTAILRREPSHRYPCPEGLRARARWEQEEVV